MSTPITRTPIVNDDGTGTTGTILDNAWKQELYDQIDAVDSANGATYAPINSPAFTGTPTAPTAAPATNTTQVATTAFVMANAGTFAARAVCYHSQTQSLANNTDTALAFDTEEVNVGGVHSGANNTRFTVPAGQGGVYLITASCLFQPASATGQRIIKALKNGTTTINGGGFFVGSPSATYNASAIFCTLVVLVAGDYIEFIVNQNSGAGGNVGAAGAAFYSTRGAMIRMA